MTGLSATKWASDESLWMPSEWFTTWQWPQSLEGGAFQCLTATYALISVEEAAAGRVGPHNFPGDPPAALPVKILSPASPPSTPCLPVGSLSTKLCTVAELQSCGGLVTSTHSCNCIACIPSIEVNRAVHNSAHLIDTVPPSRACPDPCSSLEKVQPNGGKT